MRATIIQHAQPLLAVLSPEDQISTVAFLNGNVKSRQCRSIDMYYRESSGIVVSEEQISHMSHCIHKYTYRAAYAESVARLDALYCHRQATVS